MANFNDRVKKILKYKNKGKLLEIGCAYGYFLKAASKHFKTEGIDLNKAICDRASQISKSKTASGDFLKMRITENTYDLVCLFDTIEHLKKPHKYLKKIFSILKSKGLVVVETGDSDSVVAKIRRDKWRLINPEVHLTYFSKKKLIQLLTNNGFEILEVKRLGHRRTITQILFRTMGTQKLILPFMYNLLININLYDIVFVIAQKK